MTRAATSSSYVCLVTGASRGIGQATAAELARRGATVVTVGRDAHSTIACDLASFASIRSAAEEINARFPRIQLLVNNAGVQHLRRTLSGDGLEATLTVNHLAPFLLTHLLLPSLRAGSPSRVVTISSSLARWGKIDFDDLQSEHHYNGTRAYLQSKLANIMFTASLAERLENTGVSAVCVYPGLVMTDLMRERWWWRARWLRPLWRGLFLSPNEAAERVVVATTASTPTDTPVCFTLGGRYIRAPRRARDAAARSRLWEFSARSVGVDL
ncbi:MAG TPA: SDR family NAD(P)-dependent oxidoreductase [Gemmatimonadaceae bacterium]|jgi:NAD(P)-dependent dehydrogenase (short-subunit alcohol dehydrogenase family)